MVAAVGMQHVELRTTRWTATTFWEVSEGIAGRQWMAYLEILWSSTSLAALASKMGYGIGITAHVAKDIKTFDRRYTMLLKSEKELVANRALQEAENVRQSGLKCFDELLDGAIPILRSQL